MQTNMEIAAILEKVKMRDPTVSEKISLIEAKVTTSDDEFNRA